MLFFQFPGQAKNETTKTSAKTKLMSDLFNDSKDTKDATKSPFKTNEQNKASKTRLMADLFDDEKKDSKILEENNKGSMNNSSGKPKVSPKKTDDIDFGDDNDLFGDFDNQRNSASNRKSRTPEKRGLLDDLLGNKSPINKPKEKPKEFVLDEKYLNMGKETTQKPFLNKKNRNPSPKKSPINNIPDILSSSDAPRRKRPPSARQNKVFEVDDEDILSSIPSRRQNPSRRSPLKASEQENEDVENKSFNKNLKNENKSKDDWLFDGKETSTEGEIGSDLIKTPTKANDDWLNGLLESNKNQTTPTKQVLGIDYLSLALMKTHINNLS